MNETEDTTLRTVAVILNPTPTAPADARRFIVDVLDQHPAVESAKLIISELVTNAVLHGGRDAGQVTVSVSEDRNDGSVRLDVSQPEHPGFDFEDNAPGHMESTGRGLMIVEALADDWGFDNTTGSVWVVLS